MVRHVDVVFDVVFDAQLFVVSLLSLRALNLHIESQCTRSVRCVLARQDNERQPTLVTIDAASKMTRERINTSQTTMHDYGYLSGLVTVRNDTNTNLTTRQTFETINQINETVKNKGNKRKQKHETNASSEMIAYVVDVDCSVVQQKAVLARMYRYEGLKKTTRSNTDR